VDDDNRFAPTRAINDATMKPSTFAKKCRSAYLWGNIAAMIIVSALALWGVKWGLDRYTHHGERIAVPDVRNKTFADAKYILEVNGLIVTVGDTGYVKQLPADCVLKQDPTAGTFVKTGREITLIVNSSNAPTLAIPDIIDNSSLREATYTLRAMGFRLGAPEYITGEKDWVYGITLRGKHLIAGDRVSVNDMLIIQVGSGIRDENDSIEYTDVDDFVPAEIGGIDEFEVVDGPVTDEETTIEEY